MTEPNFEKQNGLIPAVIQDYQTNKVLMVGYMNKESYEKTLETGKATYFSRSRNKLWVKGESSGNVQEVKEIYIDCDEDTLLIKVNQIGNAACHLGYQSCFFRKYSDNDYAIVEEKIFDPEEVYGKKSHNKSNQSLKPE